MEEYRTEFTIHEVKRVQIFIESLEKLTTEELLYYSLVLPRFAGKTFAEEKFFQRQNEYLKGQSSYFIFLKKNEVAKES